MSSYLLLVYPLGHRPGRHHVVHHSLGQCLRHLEQILAQWTRWKPSHLVKLHELPDAVEHVVVLGGGARHLLDDGGHVSEDGGVEEG